MEQRALALVRKIRSKDPLYQLAAPLQRSTTVAVRQAMSCVPVRELADIYASRARLHAMALIDPDRTVHGLQELARALAGAEGEASVFDMTTSGYRAICFTTSDVTGIIGMVSVDPK